MPYTTSPNVSTLIQAADYSAFRTALGVAPGTNVQAYSAVLTTWSGITPGTGVGTMLATFSSANIAAACTDETGTGALVFATSPTLAAPTLTGTTTAATINGTTLNVGALAPTSDDGAALGDVTHNFSDLFLATGSVINYQNGNVVLTHSSGIITMGTGEMRITTVGTNTASVVTVGGAQTLTGKVLTAPTITTSLKPTSDDGAPLGDTTHNFSDLFLATGAVLNYQNGNVVVTHTSGILTMGTGDFRVTTAGTNTASVVTVDGAQTLANKTFTAPALGTPASGDATNLTKLPHSISFTVDGGGTALATGTQIPVKTPYGGTLVGYTMTASPSGSITFNIFRAADGAGLPTASIINNAGGGGGTGTLPAIASGVEGKSTTFTNWGSTTITANDNLALNLTTVDSVVTKATLVLYYR